MLNRTSSPCQKVLPLEERMVHLSTVGSWPLFTTLFTEVNTSHTGTISVDDVLHVNTVPRTEGGKFRAASNRWTIPLGAYHWRHGEYQVRRERMKIN